MQISLLFRIIYLLLNMQMQAWHDAYVAAWEFLGAFCEGNVDN